MRIHSVLSAAVAALIAQTAFANDVRLYRHGETPDPREVAAILDAPKTRSIRLIADLPAAAGGSQVHQTMARPEPDATPSAFALPVRFAFDSAQVLPESMPALEAVARGIKLAGPHAKVVIEGHTDAAGPDAYNLMLSQKRALAVKAHLVLQHGVPAENLRTVGLGENALINPRNPLAGENRRVQFSGG